MNPKAQRRHNRLLCYGGIVCGVIGISLLAYALWDWHIIPDNPLLERAVVLNSDADDRFDFSFFASGETTETRLLILILPTTSAGNSVTLRDIFTHIKGEVKGTYNNGKIQEWAPGDNDFPASQAVVKFRSINLGVSLVDVDCGRHSHITISGTVSPGMPHPMTIGVTKSLVPMNWPKPIPTSPDYSSVVVTGILGVISVIIAVLLLILNAIL